MKIFRIEHEPSKSGPFNSVFQCVRVAMHKIQCSYTDIHEDNSSHPTPIYDFGINGYDLEKSARFGCDSFDMLKHWFVMTLMTETDCEKNLQKEYNAELLKAFKDYEYSLLELDVPDEFCQYGNSLTQLLFDSSQVTNITRHPIDELYVGHI